MVKIIEIVMFFIFFASAAHAIEGCDLEIPVSAPGEYTFYYPDGCPSDLMRYNGYYDYEVSMKIVDSLVPDCCNVGTHYSCGESWDLGCDIDISLYQPAYYDIHVRGLGKVCYIMPHQVLDLVGVWSSCVLCNPPPNQDIDCWGRGLDCDNPGVCIPVESNLDTYCVKGYIAEYFGGLCVIPQQRDCPEPYIWNPDLARCVCPQTVSSPWYVTSDCRVLCDFSQLQCSLDQYQDENTCSCMSCPDAGLEVSHTVTQCVEPNTLGVGCSFGGLPDGGGGSYSSVATGSINVNIQCPTYAYVEAWYLGYYDTQMQGWTNGDLVFCSEVSGGSLQIGVDRPGTYSVDVWCVNPNSSCPDDFYEVQVNYQGCQECVFGGVP